MCDVTVVIVTQRGAILRHLEILQRRRERMGKKRRLDRIAQSGQRVVE
jgi:hypothetical protein